MFPLLLGEFLGVELLNNTVKYMFIFLRKCPSVLHLTAADKDSGCSTPLQHLLLSVFITTILVGVKWHPCVLSRISLRTNGGEQLFTCLFAIYISSLAKYSFKSFVYLVLGGLCS